jgi:hypothetical protein
MSIVNKELEYSVAITNYNANTCVMTIILTTTPSQTKELQELNEKNHRQFLRKFNEGLQFLGIISKNLPKDKELYEALEHYLPNNDSSMKFCGKGLEIPETELTVTGTVTQILQHDYLIMYNSSQCTVSSIIYLTRYIK